MKTVFFLLLPLFCLKGLGQTKATAPVFEYWISSLDNASFFDVMTYHITGDSIIVIHGSENDSLLYNRKMKPVFKASLSKFEKANLLAIASSIKSDSMKTFYHNPCIIDGMILEFRFKWLNKIKRTTLSNYYLETLQPFIDIVNKKLPKKYRLWYDKTTLENDYKKCSQK